MDGKTTDDKTVCAKCGKPVKWIASVLGEAYACEPPIVSVVCDSGRIVYGRIPHKCEA